MSHTVASIRTLHAAKVSGEELTLSLVHAALLHAQALDTNDANATMVRNLLKVIAERMGDAKLDHAIDGALAAA